MKVENSLYQFKFNGLVGYVFSGGFVQWGGMSFHSTSAKPELRKAIDQASK